MKKSNLLPLLALLTPIGMSSTYNDTPGRPNTLKPELTKKQQKRRAAAKRARKARKGK